MQSPKNKQTLMQISPFSRLLPCIPVVLLAACTTATPPSQVSPQLASQWHAAVPARANSTNTTPTLPHQGSVDALFHWWQGLGDTVLLDLMTHAQAASPSITTAASRVQQARSASVAAGAALLPNLTAAANASRGVTALSVPLMTSAQAGLQSSWELDLWGGNRAAREAALARLDGSAAQWHDARVAVAAEVATTYLNLRTCEQLLAVAKEDAASRNETSRLTGLTAQAGFTAPANAALAQASAAQAQSNLVLQRTQCDSAIKALVYLTVIDETDLRKKLNKSYEAVDLNAYNATKLIAFEANYHQLQVPTVPAQLLAQRPDVFAAQQEVAAASSDVGSAQAARYPNLSLSGSIAAANLKTGGISTNGTTWAIGPVALTLPLFDGGQRAANVDAAQARYTDAVATYRAKARNAVREVEDALLTLQSTAERNDAAIVATRGYTASFNAAQARYNSGLGSLADLEDNRRTALAAKTALLNLQHERSNAWIALYRAVGGGWAPADGAVKN